MTDPTSLLTFSTVALAFFGLVVLFRPDLFSVSASYSAMADLAPPLVWGLIALAISVATVFERGAGNVWALILMSMYWAAVSISLLMANGVTTGVTTYGLLWAFTLATLVRARRRS